MSASSVSSGHMQWCRPPLCQVVMNWVVVPWLPMVMGHRTLCSLECRVLSSEKCWCCNLLGTPGPPAQNDWPPRSPVAATGVGVQHTQPSNAAEEDGVAPMVEHRIWDPKSSEVRTPLASGAQETFVIVFPSQKRCADSLSVWATPVCTRTHKNNHVRTLKIM